MKLYYINYCVSRCHTEDPDDKQLVLEMPDDYVPAQDRGLMQMREAIDKELLFYTEGGKGIYVKSFSRMDI